MLQGKATIRLKDASGRIVHEESHKNTITPSILRAYAGNLSGTLDYTKLAPLFNKFLGGICCFNGTVSASDVFLPKATDATLTAHAGQRQYASASADIKRGNPNNNTGMSGPISNGYKWTWEWLPTQGNGTISDLVLTHADTGDFWNESSPNTMAADFEPIGDANVHNLPSTDFVYVFDGDYSDIPQITNMKRIPVGFYEDIDHVVSIEPDYTNSRINVYISKFTGSGVWLWNEIGEPYEQSSPIPFNVSHTQWGTWERYGRFMFSIAYDKTNKKLYAFTFGRPGNTSYLNTWSSKKIYASELNLSTGTTSNYEIDATDALGDNYLANWGALPEGDIRLIKIVGGSVFFDIVTGSGTFTGDSLRVNLSDHSDMETVEGLGSVVGQNSNGFAGAFDLGNDRIFYCDNFAAKNSDGDYVGYEVHRDDTNGSALGVTSPNMRLFAIEQFQDSPIQYMTRLKNGTYEDDNAPPRGCMLNKLYAATVFHLETAVTKTNALTMTVEYELTQIGGDES